jgi:hypothetical protein
MQAVDQTAPSGSSGAEAAIGKVNLQLVRYGSQQRDRVSWVDLRIGRVPPPEETFASGACLQMAVRLKRKEGGTHGT